MFLPICSTISTSIGENGSLGHPYRARFQQTTLALLEVARANASMTAVFVVTVLHDAQPEADAGFSEQSRARRW